MSNGAQGWSSWLPAEISRAQPYSMGPVSRWNPEMMRVSPATGTVTRMDRPKINVRLMFVAPASVQRDAQRVGERGIMMIRAPGLLDAVAKSQEKRR